MGAGVDVDAWGETVPDAVRKQADAVRAKMLAGWSPFTGELKDNKGAVRLAAGHTMTEPELYNWNWSVDGVVGL
jgi:basic membrane lipoprotein Med (substrate-binding protein (PBP1-ABC) superfamily)